MAARARVAEILARMTPDELDARKRELEATLGADALTLPGHVVQAMAHVLRLDADAVFAFFMAHRMNQPFTQLDLCQQVLAARAVLRRSLPLAEAAYGGLAAEGARAAWRQALLSGAMRLLDQAARLAALGDDDGARGALARVMGASVGGHGVCAATGLELLRRDDPISMRLGSHVQYEWFASERLHVVVREVRQGLASAAALADQGADVVDAILLQCLQ